MNISVSFCDIRNFECLIEVIVILYCYVYRYHYNYELTAGQVAASGHDVPGAIKLNPDGTVLVYNSHVNDFINICWVKDMSENIPNTICKQLGLAKAQHWLVNSHSYV